MLEILVNYFLTDVLVSFIVISYLIDSFLKNILRVEFLILFFVFYVKISCSFCPLTTAGLVLV